jgi:hypothetical protein
MNMWSIPGKSVPVTRFPRFEPDEVLYEFDGPRIFVVRDSEGELNLAYWSDEDDAICRYVVVPTTANILQALRQGDVSVFDALNQPRCWLCDVTHQGQIAACQRVDFEAIPKDSLPAAGTMLLPTLEPQCVDLEGRIREIDKDRRSFELRDIPGVTQAQRFGFDEHLQEQVFQAFRDDERVRISGRTFPAKNMAHALAVSKIGARP